MKKTGYYYRNGLTRQEYETDRAQLSEFTPVESNWKELFRWLISCGQKIDFYNEAGRKEGMISDLWHNHVLTVLIEIVQKNITEYKGSFIEGRGTVRQFFFIKKLYARINDWIKRLEKYQLDLYKASITEHHTGLQVALLIRKRLAASLPKAEELNGEKDSQTVSNQLYYKMLNGIKDISRECDRYMEMIEANGDMDASLALLLTYIRNYCQVAKSFNHAVQVLPDFYRKEILQVSPGETVQDKAYLIVTPAGNTNGFFLPEGTHFMAGENADGTTLVYRTSLHEYITPMRLKEMNTVFLERTGNHTDAVYKQAVELNDTSVATSLFSSRQTCDRLACGWMIESPILVLNEGKRSVEIAFRLTEDSASFIRSGEVRLVTDSFSVWLSCTEGWGKQEYEIKTEIKDSKTYLIFSFTIKNDAEAPILCTEEIHHIVTGYPAVRLIMENQNCPYDWATRVRFDTLFISADVSGIQNFTFYNELGALDTSQPVYPFGTQPAQGAWFMFGNEEMGLKCLMEVGLTGKWNKLPPTAGGYTDIYKEYPCNPPITNESFRIKTEWQENGSWHACSKDLQPLFLFTKDKSKPDEDAEIHFSFSILDSGEPQTLSTGIYEYEYDCDRNGFFRVTLQEPTIGFGLETYRDLFTTTLIYNSHHKEKKQKGIPSTPIIPMLSDMELHYKAYDRVSLTDIKKSPTKVSRITGLTEYDSCILDKEPTFLPEIEDSYQLYWRFSYVGGEQGVQMYFNLDFIKNSPFQPDPKITEAPEIVWEYLRNSQWISLSFDEIVREETNGFTQSGFIELKLPETIDANGGFCLRARIRKNAGLCLAVRNVWLNYISTIAINGDGHSLPAGTIQEMPQPDERIESVSQPMVGFGGKPAETTAQTSIHQSFRIAHRNRAVLSKDYERMVLEQFPEIEKACNLSFPGAKAALEVKLVVFCRTEGNAYFVTPVWKLAEISRYLSAYISPFVSLQVINPVYYPVDVSCCIILKPRTKEEEKVRHQLIFIIRNYLAPWIRQETFPEPGEAFSYKGLHSRIANHEQIRRVTKLVIDKKTVDENAEKDTYLVMNSPWIIPVPDKIEIKMLSATEGIDEAAIGNDFKIG